MSGRHRTVRPAVVAAVIGLAWPAGSAGAAPAAGPTMSATSEVGGHRTAAPFVSGDWTFDNGVWTAELRSWATPSGSTVVTAAWRSPTFRPARNRPAFAVAVHVEQQAISGVYAVSHRVRLCRRAGCGRWETMGTDDAPDLLAPETLPYRVTSSTGISIQWNDTAASVWFEWRYSHRQRNTSVATTTIRLAAGSAAARVT